MSDEQSTEKETILKCLGVVLHVVPITDCATSTFIFRESILRKITPFKLYAQEALH